jgi:hypothetical protein
MTRTRGFVTKAAMTTAALAVAALMSYSPAAKASTYELDGVVPSVSLGGGLVDLTINYGNTADSGGFDVTSVSGTVFGVAVKLAGGYPGPGENSSNLSPDNLFYYDNIIYPTGAPGSVFDYYGLLLQSSPLSSLFVYANIFGVPGVGSPVVDVYTSANGGYPYAGVLGTSFAGTFATPLPSTWTMLIAGIIGLGFFAYRGAKNRPAEVAAA